MNPPPAFRRRRWPAAACVWRGGVVAAAVALGLGGWAADAKPLAVPFGSEFQADAWGLDEGFPENSCSGIVAAPDGYLWLGTYRGLVRFNGQKFRHWGPAAMPGLARTTIINMYRDRAGRVWLSTNEGLVCFDGTTWKRWQEEGGWGRREDFVRSYAEAPDGTLVFGRFNGGVTRLEGGEFRELPALPGSGGVWCAFDQEGVLHAARAGFVGSLQNDGWQPLPGEAGLGANLRGAGQDRAGHAVVLGRQELLRLRGGRIAERVPLTQEVRTFWQLTTDASGALWLPTIDSGPIRIAPSGEVTVFGRADGLPHTGGTRVVYPTADGVWIGGGVGGLARLRPKRFYYVGENEGLGDRVILSLAPLRDGRILMTTYGAGPAYFDGKQAVPLSVPNGDDHAAFVRTAIGTQDGTTWLGTRGRALLRLANDTTVPVDTGVFDANESIDTMFEDSQHRLWVGGERHLAVGSGGRFREIPLNQELQRRRPKLLTERRDGTVLVALDHELYSVAPEGLSATPTVKLPNDWRVSTLAVDAQDRLWIGTVAHGLAVARGDRWWSYPAGAGLPGNTISSLVQDDTGKLWFGSDRAIVRADPEDLWRVALGGAERATLQVFDTNDGLRDLDLPYGTQPGVAKDARGRLWFALVRGAAMIDPAKLQLNTQPPRVVVESLSYVPRGARAPVTVPLPADGAPLPLPAGSRLIRVGYAALDFTAPHKQLFRVRLGGERGQWQDMREDSTIDFLELPPGPYTIQIQAAGSDGAWNLAGATLTFELAPFYWQTAWFRVLLAVTGIGLVAGAAWLAAHLRLHRERETLARERRFAEVRDALRGLAMKLTESLEPEALGRAVAEASRALLGHDAFVLVAAGTEGDAGTCVYMEDTPLDADQPHHVPRRGAAAVMSLGPVRDGEPRLFNRTLTAGEGAGVPALAPWGFVERRSRSLMFAPVMWNGRVTGAVSVQSYTAERYGAAELELLQTLAAHCGAAIARLAAEIARRENEERLRLAMLSAHMGSWEIDLTDGRLFASPEAASVYGCAPGALNGSPDNLAAGAPPDEAAELRGRLQALVQGRATELDFSHRHVTWAGAELWLELKARARPGSGPNAAPRIIGVTANITARRLAELERTKLEEQLRQTQKLEAIGTLAGGIAHDFNNILTAIIGNVELARADLGAGHGAREYLDAINKSGLRARDLVRRILAFSQPREKRRQLTALLPAVEEVVKLLQPTVPAHIDLKVTAAPQLPPVEIDSTEIHQVLLNLGTNAWHAIGSRPGKIEFALDTCPLGPGAVGATATLPPGDYVRVAVSDTGSGIAPDVLPRIFDPFFTTKRTGEGTGLGLSVAHGIMRSNGGAITVQSSPGIGSKFTLYLPAAAAREPEPAAPVASETIRPTGRGERILYVDDEPLLVSVVERLLTRAGYTVIGCTRPHDALAAFHKEPASFALVISDLSMPKMTGLELAAELRRIQPDAAIILSTGFQRVGVAEQARALGIRAVINKADSADELLPLVTRVLAERAASGPR